MLGWSYLEGSDDLFFSTSRQTAGEACSQQTTLQLPPTQSQLVVRPPLRGSCQQYPGHFTRSLPPLRQLSSTLPTLSDRKYHNMLDVRSVLDFQSNLIEEQQGRQSSGFHMETIAPRDTQTPHSLPSIDRLTGVDYPPNEPGSRTLSPPPGIHPGRNISNPRLPSLRKINSFGGLSSLSCPVDAKQSPFLTVTLCSSKPAVSRPALNTRPAEPILVLSPSLTKPTPTSNVRRTIARRSSAQSQQSGSARTITQSLLYSRTVSIASKYNTYDSQRQYVLVPSEAATYDAHRSNSSQEMERKLVSVAPSGEGNIQIMTIRSQQGHNVHIPVDVQTASKITGEKRKRNASASARFRIRRKEKKREASASISRVREQACESLSRVSQTG
jgi:hypothetical protein